ncbi:S41 family peptidase, partial [uncultured Anoxybacillus sp.]|uniref:S41 family peptidase n=1 Tax=uncultured Anoxybacillus sp. TaxID=263860 RepID=UPI00260DD461
EMVAAALRDYNAATLYGQTTFGKGTMQQIFAIDWDHPDESDVLKLTVAEFFSPTGHKIHEVGVSPHIATAEGEELVRAHYDALQKQYKYKKIKELEKKSGATELVVTFSAPIDVQTLRPETFQFVELGGEEIPLTFNMLSDRQVKLQLAEPLQMFRTYVLYIHPQAKSEDGKRMKQGYEIVVRVK